MSSKLLRLLLVEDSENDALLILTELKSYGYETDYQRVYTGEAMRQALNKHDWDVIIADYKIPRFGALEALKILHETGFDIPFIVVSGTIGERTAVEMMRAGAHDYLMKDNLTRLIPAIEREMKDARNRAERHRAQELSSRLGRIVENSPSEIYVFNAETLHLVQINKGALRNSGYSQEESLTMVFFDFAPDLNPHKLSELTADLYTGQQDSITCELNMQRKDGSVYPAEAILSYSRAENPPVLLAIMQDISQRKAAEAELRATAQRLERSNKELQSFAHIASHDLQEPLRKVQLFSNRIENKYALLLDETGKEYIQRMQNAVQRMQTMISDLLKYARLSANEAQPMERVNLNIVLREVLSNLELQIEQVNGSIQLENLPTIPAYPVQMIQLFQNLLSNALKYHHPQKAPFVKVYCNHQLNTLEIIVEDNGIGIPADRREHIFGFFQRLHSRDEYEGNGIGLSICRKIMDNHAGTIRVDSKENHGSCFILSFPIVVND
jgi:two-component system, LuxR family, sensor kinase FixL